VVEAIRALKGEMGVATTKPPLTFVAPDAAVAARIARHRDLLAGLARVSEVASADQAPAGSVSFVAGGGAAALTLAGLVDVAAERARLDKEIAARDADAAVFSKKLDNPNFVTRAAPEVVQEQREKLAAAQADRARLEAARERLAALV
jgi:valyl-tRNA synthetase